ncbi:MAG TPA: envelope stress response membrane protein PspB [Gammaproteobacteria bacterium]|jgi:phage shock protein B|nr:envelope stress response membrane protein PspB [Gammaproteobacteria bacterium]HET7370971.1 envelope stress response membrane protein PspB [Gammaproteobacteria bacterium]HET7586821.1 envelope stress response membrane protein PspB [Gammaproteobacteria bacterium]
MEELTGIIVVFCIFVAPLWLILHYTTKRRQAQGLTREDEKMLSELWQLANRMESRVNSLETILDSKVPDWRNKV